MNTYEIFHKYLFINTKISAVLNVSRTNVPFITAAYSDSVAQYSHFCMIHISNIFLFPHQNLLIGLKARYLTQFIAKMSERNRKGERERECAHVRYTNIEQEKKNNAHFIY